MLFRSVVAPQLSAQAPNQVTSTAAIPDGLMGLDIGPKTVELIKNELPSAKIIFWNGPMGAFETKPFHTGTFSVAQAMANTKAVTVVGGGDSVTAVQASGLADKMTHISTGGGASLEYLEGKKLPGLEILREKS